jgi:hypothetical protein
MAAMHPREMAASVRDPNVEHGPFKVYNRTDGQAVVIDRRLWRTPDWASAGVAVLDSEHAAAVEAHRLERERLAQLAVRGAGDDWSGP